MNAELLVWFYAGIFAGVLSTAVEEPAYASIFVMPLMLAVGEQPQVVVLSFTISTGLSGLLNLVYQKFGGQGAVIHFDRLQSVPVLLGVVIGVVVYIVLSWELLKFLIATSALATAVKIASPEILAVKAPARLRSVVNFLAGFLDSILGTTLSFAFVRVIFGEVEALIPLLRTLEATEAVALKGKVIIGGILAGLGIFTGQRLVSCARSKLAEYAVTATLVVFAIWILILP